MNMKGVSPGTLIWRCLQLHLKLWGDPVEFKLFDREINLENHKKTTWANLSIWFDAIFWFVVTIWVPLVATPETMFSFLGLPPGLAKKLVRQCLDLTLDLDTPSVVSDLQLEAVGICNGDGWILCRWCCWMTLSSWFRGCEELWFPIV